MKKIFKGFILSVILLSLLFGCSNSAMQDKASFEGGEYKSIDSNLDLNAAREVAEIRLDMVAKQEGSDWNDRSHIVGSYPIYTPGIDGASHYEFKVKTGEDDAGYVLVGVTKADLQVPELSTTGLTMTEQYREATGEENIKIMRFNSFESSAESSSTTREGNSTLLATMGLRGKGLDIIEQSRNNDSLNEEYTKMKNNFAKEVKEKGCLPIYEKAGLEKYYSEVVYADTRGPAPYIIGDSDELNNKFPNDLHLPSWTQPDDTNGYPVGCGPSAWALAYSYWRQFKLTRKSNISKVTAVTQISGTYGRVKVTLRYNFLDKTYQDITYNISVYYCGSSSYTATLRRSDVMTIENRGIEYFGSARGARIYFSDWTQYPSIYFFDEEKPIPVGAIIYDNRYTKLFEGDDLLDGYTSGHSTKDNNWHIKSAMSKIHNHCGSWNIDWPYEASPTLPWSGNYSGKNMRLGYQYGRDCGYSNTTTSYNSIWWDWTGSMNFIWNEITNDRPVVIYFDAGAHTKDGGYKWAYWHYGVAEGISKRYWSNTGWATELGIQINFCWAGTRKWIYAYSIYGLNSVTSCYEAYALNVK